MIGQNLKKNRSKVFHYYEGEKVLQKFINTAVESFNLRAIPRNGVQDQYTFLEAHAALANCPSFSHISGLLV